MHIVKALAEVGTAVGTVAVAVLAIWGDHIRAWLDPPQLVLGPGSLSVLVNANNGRKQRYYLIRVRNKRRPRPAHEVRPMLTCLEERENDGFNKLFTERLFLQWDRQESLWPELTVGTDAFFSLFFIQDDGLLEFTSSSSLVHFPAQHQAGTYRATVQAISEETDSKQYQVTIHWSGGWHDGNAEIKPHCRVEIDPPE
jgi:hypothetical protein